MELADASYLHEMTDIDPKAARLFQKATHIGAYRHDVPPGGGRSGRHHGGEPEGLRPLHAVGRQHG